MNSQTWSPSLKGALFGLLAAALFGLSMPVAKQLLEGIQPFLLAGLFYLGSGTGLSIYLLLMRRRATGALQQAPLQGTDWLWLGGAILFGGVLAELLVMWGLNGTAASEASLLLNLEGAFSAVIAWVLLREHASVRIVIGMLLLTAGAFALAIKPGMSLHFSVAELCVIGACLGWAIDNNLTRRISHSDPSVITALKGLSAGAISTLFALSMGAPLPALHLIPIALITGFLSYGVSLVFFILSMRYVGTARAAAYFSSAPFVGAAASIVWLHEPITAGFLAAAGLMGAGICLHLSEHHEHTHMHEAVTHEHAHVHDEHHLHEHAEGDPQEEPHSHVHTHEPMSHSHTHSPDIHHRHGH